MGDRGWNCLSAGCLDPNGNGHRRLGEVRMKTSRTTMNWMLSTLSRWHPQPIPHPLSPIPHL